jgi:hypothetical protein
LPLPNNVDIERPQKYRSPRFQTRRTWVVVRSCAVWQTVRTNTGRIPCILHIYQILSVSKRVYNALFDIIHTLPDYCSAAKEGPLSKWWRIQIFDASQYDDCYKLVQAVHSLKIGDESSRSRVNKSTNCRRYQLTANPKVHQAAGICYRLNNWDHFFFPSPSRFRVTRRHSVVCQSFPQVSTVASTAVARNTFTVLRWSRTFLSNFTPSSRLDLVFQPILPTFVLPEAPSHGVFEWFAVSVSR